MGPVICFIIGTRPEAIKVAPIVNAIQKDGRLSSFLLSTGQHSALVEQALGQFYLTPDATLTLDRTSGTLSELAVLLLPALDRLLANLNLAAVVVQGDTLSAMVGALAAFWRRIPVAHCEAGLRSGDLAAPFPEEANRKIVDHLSSLHLAPTDTAAAHLQREGIMGERVLVTGNTVVDALHHVSALNLPYDDPRLDEIEVSNRKIVLVTVHRRESWGAPMRRILYAVRALTESHSDIHVVLPAHPNRTVRREVEEVLGKKDRVLVCDPLSYAAMARLLAKTYLVLSDSGGIQEEAPTFGVPVLVLRDVTERTEAIQAGCARLVGTDPDLILSEATRILTDPVCRCDMVAAGNPFGDGHAAERTVAALRWWLGEGPRPAPFVARQA